MSKNNRQIFYAVGIGRRPGVYRSWDECKKELIGVVNPIYKKFCSLIEAKKFVKEWSNKTPKSISNNTQILKISKELNSMETSNISQHCNTTQKSVDNNTSLKGDNIILGNHELSNYSYKFPICTKYKTKRSHSLPCENLNFKNEEYLDLECKGSTYSPVGLVESVYFSNYKSFCISRKDRKQLDNEIFQMSYTELIDALKKRSSLEDDKSSSGCEKIGFNVEFNENSETVKKELSDPPTHTNSTFRISPVDCSVNNEEFFKTSNVNISSSVLEDKNLDEISSFKLEPNSPECTNFDIIAEEENPNEQNFSSEMNDFETFAYDTNFKRNEPEFDHDDLNYTTTRPIKNSLNNLDYIHDFRANLKNFLLLLNNNFDNNSVTKTMVTTVAEQIINFISDSLKHITAGIVAAINDEVYTSESSESVAEKNEDHILPTRDMNISNPCSRMTDNQRDMKNINEKLNICERKIDKCLNQINMIASGFIEIKNEFKNLFQIMCKNSASVHKVHEKFQPSVQKANYSVSTQNFLNKTYEIQTFTSKSNNKNKFELSDLEDTDTNEESRSKKLKRSCSHDKEPNTFIPYDSRLNDEQVKKEKLDYVGFTIDKDDYVVVYTDGACHSNGKESARAGIGIWFGDGHPLNVSKPISGVPTNNNAEIQAARIAIEMALSAGKSNSNSSKKLQLDNIGISKLKICTDSEFLINCATAWMKRWKTNNWMTKSKTQVKNRKELEKLDRVMSMLSVRWEKVAGHAGIRGNEMADQLANNGAHL